MSISLQDEARKEMGTFRAWQEQFLQKILVVSAIVGLLALIPAIISTEQIIIQAEFVIMFVLLVAMILVRFPFFIKASIFILFPLILGISSLLETGIQGNALYFFLAFVTFSSLLIGPRAGVLSVITTLIIILVGEYLILSQRLTLLDASATRGSLVDWTRAVASQLLISLVVLFAIQMLLESFKETFHHSAVMQQTKLVSQQVLEDRIAERTQELTRKTNLLSAASAITHQVTALQDMDRLLNQTVRLISDYFDCYHVGIYLLNQRGDFITLQAASSEGGKKLLERGYRLRVGIDGTIGYVAAEKKPRISLDVNKDVNYFDNPELSETRSELSLPLLLPTRVVGVLDLQSSKSNAFKYEEMEVYQSMADEIAVAIENARLITENELVISQLEIISNENTRKNWKTELSARRPRYRYSATGIQPLEKPVTPKEKNILSVPIILRGQKIGNILLQRKADFQRWTAQEESIASEVAAQTALALENIRLVERTKERAQREQALSGISARIREMLDLDVVLRTSAREIQKALNLQEAEIRLFPQDIASSEEKDKNASYS